MKKYRLTFGVGLIVLSSMGIADLFPVGDFFHIMLLFGYVSAMLIGASIIFEGG